MFMMRRMIIEIQEHLLFGNVRAMSRMRPNIDPGIRNRKQMLNIRDNEDEEEFEFEDFESDFMQANKSHSQHMAEIAAAKEQEKMLIVRQKYFKEKLPNFLTWNDKEQIKYLHNSDPDQWTIEKLSEGFPALPHVIKKVVQSHWTKKSPHKITNHDNNVQENWKLFKDGRINHLPQGLIEHLNKFTNRSLNLTPFIPPVSNKPVIEKKRRIKSEFGDIIQSYMNMKKEPESNIERISDTNEKPIQTFSTKRPTTLNNLRKNLAHRVEIGTTVDSEAISIVEHFKTESDVEISKSPTKIMTMPQVKYESPKGVQLHEKTERDLSHLKYPDYINIPKKLYKKGQIYKLNDCFYDDDGEFLYRVPGME